MAEGKNSFVLYSDYLELFEELSDIDAGKLAKHLFRYVNDMNPEPCSEIIKIAFIPIKKQLKRDLKHWESVIHARSEAGKKGGRPKQSKAKKAKALLEKQSKAKKAVNVNVNVNGTVEEYIYNEFYDQQIENSDNNSDYLKFVKILFGENEDKKTLRGVLSITNQLTYNEFLSCLELAKQNNTKISEKLLKIDNDKKYFKGKTSLNRTLKNWLNNRFV